MSPGREEHTLLSPDAIAETYWQLERFSKRMMGDVVAAVAEPTPSVPAAYRLKGLRGSL